MNMFIFEFSNSHISFTSDFKKSYLTCARVFSASDHNMKVSNSLYHSLVKDLWYRLFDLSLSVSCDENTRAQLCEKISQKKFFSTQFLVLDIHKKIFFLCDIWYWSGPPTGGPCQYLDLYTSIVTFLYVT